MKILSIASKLSHLAGVPLNCIARLIIFRRRGVFIYSDKASLKAVYGEGVLIERGCFISDDVAIGDYSYVNQNSSVEHATIGKYCSISSNVYIAPFEHCLHNRSTSPIAHPDVINFERANIGNDVLISLNVIILQGVSIGDGAVVAAGAIVTKDVEPYEIVGGIPAKHIGFRFSFEEIEEIKAKKWWENERKVVEANTGWLKRQTDIYIAPNSNEEKNCQGFI